MVGVLSEPATWCVRCEFGEHADIVPGQLSPAGQSMVFGLALPHASQGSRGFVPFAVWHYFDTVRVGGSDRCVSRCCFMLEGYKVNRCSRQCFALQRPLREGESYYSVVLPLAEHEEMERRDYSAEAWEGPPDGAIGWWKNRMPTSDEKKFVLAPKEVLIDLLRQMADFPQRAKSRYLLALMLMRKRIVRQAPAVDSAAATDVLCVEVIDDGSQIDVSVCEITRSESEQLRKELNELLYCEAESD